MHLEGSCQYTPNGSTGSAPGAPGGMLLTVVDDMVVDLGHFSCISRLAAWQQSTEPDVQQLPAASRRVRTLSSSSAGACSILSTRESDPTKSAGSVQGRAAGRLQSSDSRHRYRIVTLQHQWHDAVGTTAFSGLASAQLQLVVGNGYQCWSTTLSAEADFWTVLYTL